jgi:hypothetical protein
VVLVSVGDGLGAVAASGLGQQVIDVALDRAFANRKALGDLGVGQARGDKGEDFGFARGEPGGKPVRRSWSWRECRGGNGVDQVVLHGGIDGGLVGQDLAQGLVDLGSPGVLGEVAAGTCAEASRTERSSA